MPRLRFSMTTLLVAVGVIAIGCAALRYASPLVAGWALTVTLPTMLLAILAAVARPGRVRMFWAGFALFGWGYFVVVFVPVFYTSIGRYLVSSTVTSAAYPMFTRPESPPAPSRPGEIVVWARANHRLLVNGEPVERAGLVDELKRRGRAEDRPTVSMYVEIPEQYEVILRAAGSAGIGPTSVDIFSIGMLPNVDDFERVGHILFALLFALVGGLLARWLLGSPGQRESGTTAAQVASRP